MTDFGLAKGRAYTVLTTPGQMMGTLDYIAPELIRGEAGRPGGRLRARLPGYECLAGSPPFGDRHVLDVVQAHLDAPPPDLSAAPDVPRALAEVVAARWRSSRSSVRAPGRPSRTSSARRHPLIAGLARDLAVIRWCQEAPPVVERGVDRCLPRVATARMSRWFSCRAARGRDDDRASPSE